MLNEKKSGGFVEDLEKFFHELEKKMDTFNLEDLQKSYDAALKKIIRDEERENNCHYISGEFKIFALDEKNYRCSYALYFQDANETYHSLTAQTKSLDINFLKKDFRDELLQEKSMTFEIDWEGN